MTVCDYNQCAGCMVCVDMCPQKAISLSDSLEAYNAVINDNKCIKCGLCSKVCQNKSPVIANKPISWYQGWASNPFVRESASSGGIASALMRTFLETGGAVFACTFRNGLFYFDQVESSENIKQFSGSKYVKSNPVGIYKKIKKSLLAGKIVLFIGLPCQVAGLKNVVGSKYDDKLYTVDLICHGTPSPKILDQFLIQYDYSVHSFSDVRFRVKTTFQIYADKKNMSEKGTCDAYSIAFLNSICYTENCYNCKYACLERVSDLTIGDSWGSDMAADEMKQGLSLVLCQTEKGEKLLTASDISLFDVDINNAIKANHQLEHPSVMPQKRRFFFRKLEEGKTFNSIVWTCYPKVCIKQMIIKVLLQLGLRKH